MNRDIINSENFDDEFESTGRQLREEVRNVFCSLIGFIQEREHHLLRNYPIMQNNVCSVFIYDLIRRLERKGVNISRSRNIPSHELDVLLKNNNIITRVFWFQEKPMILKPVDLEILYGYKTVRNCLEPGENFWEILLKNTRMVYNCTDLDLYKEFMLTSVRLAKNRGFFGESFRNEIDFIQEKCRDPDEEIRRIEENLSYYKDYMIFHDIVFGLIGEWLLWRKINNRISRRKLLFISDMGYTPDIQSSIPLKGIVMDAEKISCLECAKNNVYRYYVEVDKTWLATFSLPVENEMNKILNSVPVLSGEVMIDFFFEETTSTGLASDYYNIKTHPVKLISFNVK